MINPFLEIPLEIYEKHMSLDSVKQLPILNSIMKNQINKYDVQIIMILGIAGGNGLEHIELNKINKVYGVDINDNYLNVCKERYSYLADHFETICVDLTKWDVNLPKADMVIANLFIEYIGYEAFLHHMKKMSPQFISMIIQINEQDGFVSKSPYIHAFDRVGEVHHQIEEIQLSTKLLEIGYAKVDREEILLPNGKKFILLDYMRILY